MAFEIDRVGFCRCRGGEMIEVLSVFRSSNNSWFTWVASKFARPTVSRADLSEHWPSGPPTSYLPDGVNWDGRWRKAEIGDLRGEGLEPVTARGIERDGRTITGRLEGLQRAEGGRWAWLIVADGDVGWCKSTEVWEPEWKPSASVAPLTGRRVELADLPVDAATPKKMAKGVRFGGKFVQGWLVGCRFKSSVGLVWLIRVGSDEYECTDVTVIGS